MDEIEKNYMLIKRDFNVFYMMVAQELSLAEKLSEEKDDTSEAWMFIESVRKDIERCIEKAQKLDLDRFKRSQGGKKSAQGLTEVERIARAKKASYARKVMNK